MHEHVDTITDLLLGAAYADKRLEGSELDKIRELLSKMMGSDSLPEAQAARISAFSPAKFNVHQSAAHLTGLSVEDRRKVIEMVAAVNDADDELDLDEDAYLANVARGMGLEDDQWRDLSLDVIEVDEFEGILGALEG